jgi:uncharacterized protein YjbI with pentapeptide repeats
VGRDEGDAAAGAGDDGGQHVSELRADQEPFLIGLGRRDRQQGDQLAGGRKPVLAGEVLARLKAGAALSGLELGEVNGRVDLRGFPAPLPRPVSRVDAARFLSGRLAPEAFVAMAEQVIVEGVSLRGLELTGARLDEVNFRRCEMEDSVLDGVSGRNLGLTFTRVRGCSFRGASLQGAGLGTWQDGICSEYEQVDFTGADLRGDPSTDVTAWFRDCDFSGARLDGTSFSQCGLVRCRFAGVLQDVRFFGSGFPSGEEAGPGRVENLDLSGTVLQNVAIRGVDLAAVRLPDDPGLRIIHNYPCVMRKAAAALRGREDNPGAFLRLRFNGQLKGIDLGPPVGLLNRNDYLRWGGEELAALLDSVIADAERECAC